MTGPAKVTIAAGAERDLDTIYRRRLAQRGADGPDGAEALLIGLVRAMRRLGDYPESGPVPPELERLGIKAYRQLSVDGFRIIYAVDRVVVSVVIVADARHDFRRLLEERLLRDR